MAQWQPHEIQCACRCGRRMLQRYLLSPLHERGSKRIPLLDTSSYIALHFGQRVFTSINGSIRASSEKAMRSFAAFSSASIASTSRCIARMRRPSHAETKASPEHVIAVRLPKAISTIWRIIVRQPICTSSTSSRSTRRRPLPAQCTDTAGGTRDTCGGPCRRRSAGSRACRSRLKTPAPVRPLTAPVVLLDDVGRVLNERSMSTQVLDGRRTRDEEEAAIRTTLTPVRVDR